MTAPSSSFTSSSSSYEFMMYDVFISFRGADTRSGFTGNLHKALHGKHIKSFMDDQDLEKGSEISSALDQAIQHSFIALVVLSRNYASSTFCLQELAKIMVCSKNKGMVVLPVFYEVEPSDVRYQKGAYAYALDRHKFIRTIDRDKIQEWRLALTNVAALSGWHFKRDMFEHELIDIIVEHIFKKISSLRDRDKYTTQQDWSFTYTNKATTATTTMEEKYSSPQKQHDFYNKDGSGGGIKGVRPPVPAILDDTSTSDNILSHKRKNLPSSSSSSSYDGDDDDDSSDDGGKSENDYRMVDDSIHHLSPNGFFGRSFLAWRKGELLGRGLFGTVYEGIADDGFSFAVKEVSLVEEGYHAKQSIFQLRQEISLMSQFKHENIVRYFGTNKENNMLYIFFELVTKESLASLYQKFPLRDSQVSEYTRQILSGLKYLHDQNVVHGDLKCANILVDASDSLKLSGFGLAKAIKLNDVRSSKGSPYWMAPEVVNLRNRGYGLAADIWSLGCTVLEMLTRQPPYSHLKGMQALFRIGKGQPPSVPESLSKDARDFILKCLQVNPSKRPTSAQLLSHPFVKRPLLFPRRISRVNLLEYFYYDVT